MKFSIIIPTFKHKNLLVKTIASLFAQTYKDWEAIIVNDSPYDEDYRHFAISINDQRIRYFVNTAHSGSNYSKNFALERISADSKWIIFLNDDEYLSPDTLTHFSRLIIASPDQKWFLSNKAYKNGTPLTLFPYDNTCYSYLWRLFILKRNTKNLTHCIESKLITYNNVRFPNHIKYSEEWFFFYQISTHEKPWYTDHNSIIVNTTVFPKTKERCTPSNATILFYEGSYLKLYRRPAFIICIFLRLFNL